MKVVQKLQV